ncbi:MAG: HAD family hydrolase [Clostridiales bacterium]|nr:HAD family hydrolase [Clostridiales bacterium]
MFSSVQWLFFDVGSTLIDESAAYARRFQDLAEAAHVSYEFVYEKALQFYQQNKKGDLEIAKMLGVELTHWHGEKERLYADAAETLKQLHKKYRIGIIANQNIGTADRLAQHGILSYIDLVIASAEEGVAKPDRRIYEIALKRAKCMPSQAVMIGDRVDNDIIPAKRLGMKTIWIKQGFGQYWQITKEEEQADAAVNSLMDICRIL